MRSSTEGLLALADPAAELSRSLDGASVHLVRIDALHGRHHRDVLRPILQEDRPWRMVVDARGATDVSLVALARVSRFRRQARTRGGDLVLVADPPLRALVRSSGLGRSLPCVTSPDDALELLENARPRLPEQPAAVQFGG